jgi:hypothetical protein
MQLLKPSTEWTGCWQVRKNCVTRILDYTSFRRKLVANPARVLPNGVWEVWTRYWVNTRFWWVGLSKHCRGRRGLRVHGTVVCCDKPDTSISRQHLQSYSTRQAGPLSYWLLQGQSRCIRHGRHRWLCALAHRHAMRRDEQSSERITVGIPTTAVVDTRCRRHDNVTQPEYVASR